MDTVKKLDEYPGVTYTVNPRDGTGSLVVPSFDHADAIQAGIKAIRDALADAKSNMTRLDITEGQRVESDPERGGWHRATFSLDQVRTDAELLAIPGLLVGLPPGLWEFLQMAGKWRGHRMNAQVGDQLTYPE